MRKRQWVIVLGLSICILYFNAKIVAATAYQALAAYWAPVVYQKTSGVNYGSVNATAQEDIFTLFNFDLDWRGNNNWNNLSYYKTLPVIYYSVVDAEGFYYIGYYLYYPRHLGSKSHENEFLGLMLAVDKDGGVLGKVSKTFIFQKDIWQVAERLPHNVTTRISINISSGSHNVSFPIRMVQSSPNTVIYYPSDQKNKHTGQNRVADGAASYYKLISMEELWRHHAEIQESRYSGQLSQGEHMKKQDISLPWLWNYQGQNWLANPAGLLQLLTKDKRYKPDYIYNPYTNSIKYKI